MDIDWDAVHARLREKVTRLECSACGHDRWDGGDAIVGVPAYAQRIRNGRPLDPDGNPQVLMLLITCENCGLAYQFDLPALMGDSAAE